eukprot:8775866-Pyramimonas_sp.AAC.1
MGTGSQALRSALMYLPAVSGPAGGAKNRQDGRETSKKAPKMAQERSKRAQDRTKAFQNWSNMA